MKLPKKYIKKYGLTKQAWAAFKKDRSKSSQKRRAPQVKTKMAKKRRSYKKKSYKKKGSSGMMKQVIGTVGYATIGEPLLDKAASAMGLNVSDDIVKGIAGILADRYGTGYVKAAGRAGWIIAINKVASEQIGSLFDKFSLGGSTQQTTQQSIGGF
jgi:dissimilatory sulfite reductase (desulfoviridin) alpha/beta subunit